MLGTDLLVEKNGYLRSTILARVLLKLLTVVLVTMGTCRQVRVVIEFISELI